MKHDFFNMPFEVKSIDESEGIIEGYASVFGNIDLGDDVIDQGAFKRTIKASKGKWPVLYQHDPSKRIGYNIDAKEDAHGLLVTEKLNLDSQMGREEFSFAKMSLELKIPFGLSIGYSTIKAEPDKERPSVRRLKEVKMWEHSHVTFPMNQAAMITAAKSYAERGEEGLGLDQHTDLFFKQMETLGHSTEEVKEALRKFGSAPASIDSSALVHSMDRLLQVLKPDQK